VGLPVSNPHIEKRGSVDECREQITDLLAL
jgi:hypothetical protein